MIQSTPDPLIVIVVSLIFGLVIPLGFYVWYGFALSRLFPKLGEQGWKGWVPILNEMVILERGGVPGWSVVLYVLPIVNLYGMYLKALAMVRLGQKFGQGAGLVVLGFVLPPLWATLLASKAASAPSENYGERIQGMMMPDGRGASSPAVMSTGPLFAPPAPPVPPAAQPATPPFVPPPAVVRPPVAAPAPPEFTLGTPVVVPPVPAGPVSAAQHVGVEPVMSMPPMPEPSATVEPVADESPWAPRSPAPAAPGRTEASAVGSPPPFDARADVAELPTIVPAQHPGLLNDEEDELDRTVVVDRRPVVRWSLVTESGVTLPLTSNSVLLGRKPASTDVSVELVAVPDETRTLSKNHARLDLRDGVWTITDLKSTNGVILVAPDGGETELPPGGSAEITAQFILGNVSLSLTFENGVS